MFSCFDKDHIWLNMRERKFINLYQENGDFLFLPFLVHCDQFLPYCELHVIFYTFGHHCARLVCVCMKSNENIANDIKPSQLIKLPGGYEKHHRMPWEKNVKWLFR